MMKTINGQSLSFQRHLRWDRESESESILLWWFRGWIFGKWKNESESKFFEKWESESKSIVLCFKNDLCLTFNLWWDRESESESIVLRWLRGRVFASGAASLCDLFVGAPRTMSSNCLSNVRSARPASASASASAWVRADVSKAFSCTWLSKRAVDKRRKEKHGWSMLLFLLLWW